MDNGTASMEYAHVHLDSLAGKVHHTQQSLVSLVDRAVGTLLCMSTAVGDGTAIVVGDANRKDMAAQLDSLFTAIVEAGFRFSVTNTLIVADAVRQLRQAGPQR
jgi:hypothetical protein